MINVREAAEHDVAAIRDIFEACYSGHYAHPGFCETDSLKHAVFDDDVLMLVAEDDVMGRVLGTAAVILDIGAFGDLIGEFGDEQGFWSSFAQGVEDIQVQEGNLSIKLKQ